MSIRCLFTKLLVMAFVLAVGLALSGTPALAGASLKTDPAAVDYNPKALATMKIMGSGFGPEDRVEIVLSKANKGQDVPVASADADKDGNFVTTMNMLSILQGIFNMRFKQGKPAPDPNNPPLPPGKYTMNAKSWDSPATASYELTINAPAKK
ncbi:MAG: hypothetical protein KKB20_22315 [Proteobacteria bacterium]|nr:hypothetical protein [Pseudomonadota bacterium]